ncbi:DUF3089 domain-containing protein [Sphingomonas sp.]|uniref:DUF3089 domain-containing protein n=1 Tax=Sphingomonas sp. TaxID=28214 RepID=UPI003AFFBA1D
MLARRFLYVVAAGIVLLLGAGLLWSLFAPDLMRAALVPSVAFAPPPAAGAPDYARPEAWVSRPGTRSDPALWLPPGVARVAPGPAAIFFVPPTTYLDRGHWNARYDDPEADARTRVILSGDASIFSGVGRVWAPRYRQATVGAFLTDKPDAARALDLAYADVVRAWKAFLAQAPADAPLILAGHSQGSFHLIRLLAEQVRGTPSARRIVAAYAVGWPISVASDLPALGLPACVAPADTGCVLSWQSFAEPAEASQLRVRYEATPGLTGHSRKGTPPLCTNPLTGARDGAAPASANAGALVPDAGYQGATLVRGFVPARCRNDGLLSIGPPPGGYGVAVLPGNNYHVFDYALFWANVRADAARRLAAFAKR